MRKFILTALTLVAFCSPVFAADNFGACSGDVRMLLSRGGAIAKITAVKQDRFTFNVTYTHEFGTVETQYAPDWAKLKTSKERNKAVSEVLAQMDEEAQAIKAGQEWYLVVNRAVFADQGLPPIYKDLKDPTKTTKWRPYYMYVSPKNECVWSYLDWAVFEDELPDGIRKQLK